MRFFPIVKAGPNWNRKYYRLTFKVDGKKCVRSLHSTQGISGILLYSTFDKMDDIVRIDREINTLRKDFNKKYVELYKKKKEISVIL